MHAHGMQYDGTRTIGRSQICKFPHHVESAASFHRRSAYLSFQYFRLNISISSLILAMTNYRVWNRRQLERSWKRNLKLFLGQIGQLGGRRGWKFMRVQRFQRELTRKQEDR